jgi:Icc-related predicted phosphoesterase
MVRARMRQKTFERAVLGLLLLSSACKEEKAVEPPKTPPVAEPPKAEPPQAEAKTSDPACAAAWNPTGTPKTFEVKGRKLELTGTKLTESTSDPDAKAIIGVMANIKEDTPENLANLNHFLAMFKQANVEAIVVVGDLAETRDQIMNVVKPIADVGVPVFAVIGNREAKGDFNDALGAFADKPVFNMNQVRLAVLDDVAFVSVPGYYDKAFIHATEGCNYLPEDLEATKPIVQAAGDKPVVLLSHGGPRQEGADALDRTAEQANVGDPALTKFLRETGVKFGVFPNIHESGGRGTDLTGTKLLPQKTMHEELYMNPGAVDAVSWPMNDGTRSVGMAAVLTIDGKKASFEATRIEEKQ